MGIIPNIYFIFFLSSDLFTKLTTGFFISSPWPYFFHLSFSCFTWSICIYNPQTSNVYTMIAWSKAGTLSLKSSWACIFLLHMISLRIINRLLKVLNGNMPCLLNLKRSKETKPGTWFPHHLMVKSLAANWCTNWNLKLMGVLIYIKPT